jgi:hypothetical protein
LNGCNLEEGAVSGGVTTNGDMPDAYLHSDVMGIPEELNEYCLTN